MPLAGADCDGCAGCVVAVVIVPDAVPPAAKAAIDTGRLRHDRSRALPVPPSAYDDYCATVEATGFAVSCFFFQSPIAARIASSANTEQWILTGGSDSSFTMSMFLFAGASTT